MLAVVASLVFPGATVAQSPGAPEGIIHETPQMMCGVISGELLRSQKQLEQARRQLRGKKGRQRAKLKERFERLSQWRITLLDDYRGLDCPPSAERK